MKVISKFKKLEIYHKLTDIPELTNPVITIGMFDGVHLGHRQIFNKLTSKAKAIGSKSVVITFDTHPRMVLQHDAYKLKFINSYQEKIDLIEKSAIDYLIFLPFTKEFSQLTTADFVKTILVDSLHINTLIVGHDNRFGNKENNNFSSLYELSQHFGFKIIQADIKNMGDIAVSSTKIRESLDKGNIRQANLMLGYSYQLSGKVIMGNQIGQKIGFPTANIDLENDFKLIPSIGVYAIKALLGNKSYSGMLNIGIRPTLNINKLSIEAHLFDFDLDIYGQYLTVFFVDKIRDEQRFESLNALVVQLKKDLLTTKEILK